MSLPADQPIALERGDQLVIVGGWMRSQTANSRGVSGPYRLRLSSAEICTPTAPTVRARTAPPAQPDHHQPDPPGQVGPAGLQLARIAH